MKILKFFTFSLLVCLLFVNEGSAGEKRQARKLHTEDLLGAAFLAYESYRENLESHPTSQDIGNPVNNFNIDVGNHLAEHSHEHDVADEKAVEQFLALLFAEKLHDVSPTNFTEPLTAEHPIGALILAYAKEFLSVEHHPLEQHIGNPENNFNINVRNSNAEHSK